MTNEQIDKGLATLYHSQRINNAFSTSAILGIGDIFKSMKEPEAKGIYIDPEYREQFDKDVARDIKIGTPDPIREVYEGWKDKHRSCHVVGFCSDMWNAIKQHCEEK